MRHLIITVGTGEGVAHGIYHALKMIRADCVYYLVTEESAQKTLPEIETFAATEGYLGSLPQEVQVKLEDKDSLDRVFRQVLTLIRKIRRTDQCAEITVDCTAGTKPMSAGAVMAACLGEVDRLTYVTGEREGGRVVSGTEALREQPLLDYWLEHRKSLFFALFDRYDFTGCHALLAAIRERSRLQRIQDFVVSWEPIVRFYERWDLFDHGACEPKGTRGVPVRNKSFLGKLRSGRFPESEWYRLADLVNNAERRRLEGRFDDAVARLYRAIELLAQVVLREKGIDTSNVDLMKIPESSREKYRSLQDEKGVVKIPLFRSFELLSDLGEAMGRRFFSDHELQNLLQARNHSILAHGVEPVSEATYQAMRARILHYAREIVPHLEELCQEGWFPTHTEVLRKLEEPQ